MHTAKRSSERLTIETRGRAIGPEELLPGWSATDRLGIVCDEAFGALGASLLIEAAATAFYDARPARRSAEPQYPETYCFHVGGPHGNLVMLDFTPARKEVFVAPDPLALLGAINDRAITWLAVPAQWLSATRSGDRVDGASAWSERSSFTERILGGFGYGAGGRVADADVTIAGNVASVGVDADYTLALEPFLELNRAGPIDDMVKNMSGPATRADFHAFMQRSTERLDEVSDDARAAVAARRRETIANGRETQTYRRATPSQLYAGLAACGA